MTYRAGELDQRITFQERIKTADGMGGYSYTWEEIPTLSVVSAHARPRSGREREQFDRVNAESSYLFVVRNRSDILESYRIIWNLQPFNIRYIAQQKSRALYLEIEAEQGERDEQK